MECPTVGKRKLQVRFGLPSATDSAGLAHHAKRMFTSSKVLRMPSFPAVASSLECLGRSSAATNISFELPALQVGLLMCYGPVECSKQCGCIHFLVISVTSCY